MMLKSKVGLVTGSSRGIGSAIARAMAQAGAEVVVSYNHNKALAEAVANDIGAKLVLQIDISQRDSVRTAVQRLYDVFGRLDILVNNAAISQEKPFETITDEDWDRLMEINLRGPFICCQEVLSGMIERKFGRIINVSSIGGQWGGFNQVHYAVSKAGVIALTRSLARIYSEHGITTNAIAPGLVFTEMSAREIESEEGKAKVQNIPIGRVATLEEVVSVVVFLASDDASYITGQTINVNGGMLFS